MENPGLKRYESPPSFIKVTYRRVAAPPPMATPLTTGTGVPPEPETLKEDLQTPPPLTGGPTAQPPSAANGAPPISGAQISSQPQENLAAEQRRVNQQQQMGGGTKENPAYLRAQQQIQQKMMVRRTGSLMPVERPHLEELGLQSYLDSDLKPNNWNSNNGAQFQPMMDVKGIHDEDDIMDSPANYRANGNGCEPCWLSKGNDSHEGYESHKYKRFARSVGERYSAVQAVKAAHPLHQASTPRGWGSIEADDDGVPRTPPGGSINSPGPLCETCWLASGHKRIFPEAHDKDPRYDHPFKPLEMEPGQRFSRVAAYDDKRRQFLYDIDSDPDYYANDHPPSAYGATDQPMFQLKEPVDEEGRLRLEEPHQHPSWKGCENCLRMNEQGDLYGPDDPMHQRHSGEYEHEYKPIEDLPAGVRLAAQVPSDDPVYPYNPGLHPERDTVDLDNLQDQDDTYRPHHPDVDRVMNHLQGLPDMSDPHQRLLDRVNDVINEGGDEGSEDEERGRNALAEGINALWGHDNLDDAKAAIDAHFEAGQLSHKEHVKRLHDDWVARGGHKTGEPRPVERFSPKFTKPQQIVPDPNNPFPELTSPILYAGKCEGCGKKLYDSADSSGDPRGALGDNTVGTIDAAEYSPRGDSGDRRMHGPSALICSNCDQESEKHNRILDKYRGHKAGDKTGDGYWGHPPGSDTRDWKAREFIPTTYGKDRKGKWHEPGEKVGSCPECDQGITGFHRRQAAVLMTQASWSSFLREGTNDEWLDSYGPTEITPEERDELKAVANHDDPAQTMHDLLGVQGTSGNWDYSPYMHGMYNGMELGSAIIDDREPEYRDAPDSWLFDEEGSLPEGFKREAAESWDMLHERPKDFNLPEFYSQHGMDVNLGSEGENLAYFRDLTNKGPGGVPRGNPSSRMMFSVQPDYYVYHDRSDDTADPREEVDTEKFRADRFDPETEPCADCWYKDTRLIPKNEHDYAIGRSGHPWRSGSEGTELSRFGSSDESDEDFWARMEREHPGQQPSTNQYSYLTPDSYREDSPEPDDEYHDPDINWDDHDLDIPENMSLRDHAHLLRAGTVRWDGDTRYPKYDYIAHREIRDSDGQPAFADEGHTIEHNTGHHGPVLPTEDNPEPDVLQYQWSHTYHPAGTSDDEGLTKGYNSPDQALHAVHQLSLWGARHPKSQELLKDYRYVGSELPYDPSVELPHEAAMRMR